MNHNNLKDPINRVIELCRTDYNFMLAELKRIKAEASKYRTDVRLCIDLEDDVDASWIIRSGLSDYDQRHSMYCGASSIDKESKPQAILEELINQVVDQAAMEGDK